jgi:hypothetical protein
MQMRIALDQGGSRSSGLTESFHVVLIFKLRKPEVLKKHEEYLSSVSTEHRLRLDAKSSRGDLYENIVLAGTWRVVQGRLYCNECYTRKNGSSDPLVVMYHYFI